MNTMIDRVPLRDNPQLFDIVIGDIQQGLAAGLPWLDHAFGKAERLVKMIGGKRYYTPNIHIGGNEYMEVSPSDDLGNFSFFVLGDPQTMQWIPGQQGRLRTTYSLIVWLDMRDACRARMTGATRSRSKPRYCTCLTAASGCARDLST